MKDDLKVALLTAGKDPHYALGLVSALVETGLRIDFIGNDAMSKAEIAGHPRVSYFNLRGDQRTDASLSEKAFRVLRYYGKLLTYARKSDARIFHILWLNKFTFFDRTLLNVYYRILGKRLVLTAHNVNAGERDGTDGVLNRMSLRFMYSAVDHVFVHTVKMKKQLVDVYKVEEGKVSVVPFGVNNMIPRSGLSKIDARRRLGLNGGEKIMLFFGNIAPYKGLEYLIGAMALLKEEIPSLRLIIAGRVKDSSCEEYWKRTLELIEKSGVSRRVSRQIGYVPDEHVELFLQAADVMILPYKHIFQSGVIFLSYNFGLPVIAADIGSLRDEIVEGETGFVFSPEDHGDLAEKIRLYFSCSLYIDLEARRHKIIEYVNERNSWGNVSNVMTGVYRSLVD